MGIYRHQNTETNRMYNTGMPKKWDTETDKFTGDQDMQILDHYIKWKLQTSEHRDSRTKKPWEN